MSGIIFHIDVNSAYLSWSALEKLKSGSEIDLRTIPSIIGGDVKSRHGVVLAKSVPAKTYGIITGEPVATALRKCPNLILEPPNHRMYDEYSRQLMNLLLTYTSDLEQLSVDECFLNFGPIAHLYPSPEAAAHLIKDTVKSQLGFTVNIGIAPNKLLAKMASDFQKPDRVHTLYKDEIPQKMWPLPVGELYMVGKSSVRRLEQLGIRTIGELADTDVNFLISHFKSHGRQMWNHANGIGSEHVNSSAREAKGIGNSTTLREDATTAEAAKQILLRLAESVSRRLRKAGQTAGAITVEIRYYTFENTSHQTTLSSHTNATNTIYECACRLFDELWDERPIRLLGIRTAKLLEEGTPVQLSLFDLPISDNGKTPAVLAAANTINAPTVSVSTNNDKAPTVSAATEERRQKLDAAIDSIRKKYGNKAVMRGSFLKKD